MQVKKSQFLFFLCFLTPLCHNQPGSSRGVCQRSHLVPPISAGGGGFRKPVLLPPAIQGFGNWSEPQDGPFPGQEDHSRPPRYLPWPAFGARQSNGGPRRRKWGGDYPER